MNIYDKAGWLCLYLVTVMTLYTFHEQLLYLLGNVNDDFPFPCVIRCMLYFSNVNIDVIVFLIHPIQTLSYRMDTIALLKNNALTYI